MTTVKTIHTVWYPQPRILATSIRGLVTAAESRYWKESLQAALAGLEDASSFRLFADMRGLAPASRFAGASLRMVVPELLAACGWRVGYMPMLGRSAGRIKVGPGRGIRCIAAAHCHHDRELVSRCQEAYGNAAEGYFTEPAQALQWLSQREPVPGISSEPLQ